MRRAIERETVADSESILQRLRSSEAFKMTLLHHDMEELQKDSKRIDQFEESLRSARTSDLLYNRNTTGDYITYMSFSIVN